MSESIIGGNAYQLGRQPQKANSQLVGGSRLLAAKTINRRPTLTNADDKASIT